ncbi:MAG: hypothetical protein OXR66_06070 [Candidatus Woesearchaeota archaeon]|nr:hypothetical protein [Candidatus Woesearchaeota archaeon]
MKRAQIEMIGLVFIVLLLVVGIMLYLRFSSPPEQNNEGTFQGATSFLVALKESAVCDASFERVAAACIEGHAFCDSGDPCLEAQLFMDEITSEFLVQHKFNLSIERTDVQVVVDCESGDQRTLLAAAPRTPIVLSRGVIGGNIVLSICR